MSTKATNIRKIKDLKRTGQMTLFNPHKYFDKGWRELDLEWTAEVYLDGERPYYNFLAPDQSEFYDGHLYLDRTSISEDIDGFTLFTFISGVYQEVAFVEHPFNPYGTAKHWGDTVKKEILKFL